MAGTLDGIPDGELDALAKKERTARSAPLDVLRPAEVLLNSQGRELEDQCIRERLPVLVAWRNLYRTVPPSGSPRIASNFRATRFETIAPERT